MSRARSAPLANKLVRQAIRYAMDYDGILQGLLKGVGTRPASAIPVGLVGNDAATNAGLLVRQDLARARALLKQAGYPNGFAVTMSYPVNWTFDGVLFDPLASKVQNDLARVGIRVTLNPTKFAVMLAAYRGQKLAMALWDWGVDYPDPNDYAGPFSPGGGVAHRVFYSGDARLVALVNQADSTTDQAKRAALYRAIQRIWLDEGPWVALVQPQDIVALGSSLKGYTYSPVFPTVFRTLSR
jgi:peptide/nickel transport system substrate-binding protein